MEGIELAWRLVWDKRVGDKSASPSLLAHGIKCNYCIMEVMQGEHEGEYISWRSDRETAAKVPLEADDPFIEVLGYYEDCDTMLALAEAQLKEVEEPEYEVPSVPKED